MIFVCYIMLGFNRTNAWMNADAKSKILKDEQEEREKKNRRPLSIISLPGIQCEELVSRPERV